MRIVRGDKLAPNTGKSGPAGLRLLRLVRPVRTRDFVILMAIALVSTLGVARTRIRGANSAPKSSANSAKTGNSTSGSKPAETTARNAENGKRLYKRDGCFECHGFEGQGAPVTGPRLAPDPIPIEAFTAYVRHPAGNMPPYTSKVVSDRELAEIYAFLQSVPKPPDAKDIPALK